MITIIKQPTAAPVQRRPISHPISMIVSSGEQKPQFMPLSLPPLDMSLTKGTNIPSPPTTPTPTPSLSPSLLTGRQTPRPGGGPLSSHPATPDASNYNNMVFARPPTTPTPSTELELKANRVLGRTGPDAGSAMSSSPTTTALPNPLPAAGGRRQPGKARGMKRLFRSFYSAGGGGQHGGGGSSSSRSISGADCFAGGGVGTATADSGFLPCRPSSSLASYRPDSAWTTDSNGEGGRSPGLRRKRSSGWFSTAAAAGKRKSGLFFIARVDEDGDGDGDGIAEGGGKENREPPPTIPEVCADTDIGGEELFRDIK